MLDLTLTPGTLLRLLAALFLLQLMFLLMDLQQGKKPWWWPWKWWPWGKRGRRRR